MYSWKGYINGTRDSDILKLPTVVKNFTLVNTNGANAVVSVYLISGIYNIAIAPPGNVLTSGQMYESIRDIVVLATENVRIESVGQIDYDFNIDNLSAP